MESYFISTKEIQVSYADTDMMGVIYHANYVKWFEIGRSQLIEDVGFNYIHMENSGFYAPVQKVEVTYKKPVKYGDKVFVKTWVEENAPFKTLYGYRIENGDGDICATGFSTHIVVSKDNFKLVQFKKFFPEWFQKYEEIKKQSQK